uniref:Uncharacterized protein n=1 Tax=Caenorhabditis japonica TaxID=281687 RepID=A0A8R1DXM5_CAEJA
MRSTQRAICLNRISPVCGRAQTSRSGGHRRLGRSDSHEFNDYDNFLFFDGDSDSENDFPDCEDVIRTQI